MTAPDPRVGEIQARLDKVPAKGESAFIGTALPVHATTELWNLRQLAREDVAYLLAELADRDEKLADVLAISDIGMNSEHGDPAFIQGWECAVEEIKARIEPVGDES